MGESFLPQRGNYRDLIAFRVSEWIFDLTYIFAQRFLSKGDRTVDQMVQAARSGKQNIVEGSAASRTSRETEIKLTNVARASLQELLQDYEDYLTTRRLQKWEINDPRVQQTRCVIKEGHDRQFFIDKSQKWNAETHANVAITMIHTCDFLLRKLINRQKEQFLQQGGIREEMSRARREYNNNHRLD